MLDCGSQVSFIPIDLVSKTGLQFHQPNSDMKITAFGGQQILIIGLINEVIIVHSDKAPSLSHNPAQNQY